MDGTAIAEIVTTRSTDDAGRPLLTELVQDGQVIGREPLPVARERHRAARDELPPMAHSLSPGDPAVPTIFNWSRKTGA
jgi:nicotinate phosphoribosyltransferase